MSFEDEFMMEISDLPDPAPKLRVYQPSPGQQPLSPLLRRVRRSRGGSGGALRPNTARYRRLASASFVDNDLDSAEESGSGVLPVLVEQGFKLFAWGFEELTKGGVSYEGPTHLDVEWEDKPPDLELPPSTPPRVEDMFNYQRETLAGIESTNIRLACHVYYNGADLQARFIFRPGGRRTRLGTEASLIVHTPVSIDAETAPSSWKNVGLRKFPVLVVPMQLTVDHPWPNSNYEEYFELILSSMYGLGRNPTDKWYQNWQWEYT